MEHICPPPCGGFFPNLLQQSFGLLEGLRKVQKTKKTKSLSFEEELYEVAQALAEFKEGKPQGLLIHPRLVQFIVLLAESLEELSLRWDDISLKDRDELAPILENLAHSLLLAVDKPKNLKSLYNHLIGNLSLQWASFKLNQDFSTRSRDLLPRVPELILEKVEEHKFGDTSVMNQFLELIVKDAELNPSKLIPYTKELDAELEDLLAGVEID